MHIQAVALMIQQMPYQIALFILNMTAALSENKIKQHCKRMPAI
ncbi:UNVERIFIED_CONTAM: hypothetical protein GTU68_011283 [Idotea baltica]|nr:hypothetical protein [Idotea baltica]